MKSLYISDLDGTLLNKNIEVTQFSKDIINKFIQGGGYFSVATARTLDTALPLIDGLNINAPVISLNGVAIYDTVKKEYEKIEIIQKDSAANLFNLLAENNITGFVHALENGNIIFFYENLNAPHRKKFHDDRVNKYKRIYTKVNSFAELLDRNIIYFSTCDEYEKLIHISELIKQDNNLNVEFYRDVYWTDFWYMEVSSVNASKYNGIKYLREKYGFEHIVCFGDNLNDLPMFEASDEQYAVNNAKDEVKSKAVAIIGSNEDDGVAKFIEQKIKE